MDSFTYGKAARQGPNLGRKPLYIALAVVLAAGVVAAAMTVVKMGGDAVVHHVKTTTKAVDTAGDLQAQVNLKSVYSAAITAFMDAGASFSDAGADQLSLLEPSFTYVDGSRPSTGPDVVSVEATKQSWGGAILSSSGTCFYLRAVGSQKAYGHGDVCTGEAAMAATGTSF
jgi:hypothetical protein